MLKSDMKRKGVKKFISWCEEYIENMVKGDKDGSKEVVKPLKGGDVYNVVDPQMETTKHKKPKKTGRVGRSCRKEKIRASRRSR